MVLKKESKEKNSNILLCNISTELFLIKQFLLKSILSYRFIRLKSLKFIDSQISYLLLKFHLFLGHARRYL